MAAPGDDTLPIDGPDWFKPGPVRDMPPAARGVYIDLLMLSWMERGLAQEQVDGPKAKRLAELSNCSADDWRDLWREHIQQRFVLSEGRYWHRRHLKATKAAARPCSGTRARAVSNTTLDLDLAPDLSPKSHTGICTETTKEACQRVKSPRGKRAFVIVGKWAATAEVVLEALNAARKRVNPRCHPIVVHVEALAGICERLEAGFTAADCLRVVEAYEADCRRDPRAFRWFDTVSPWRPANFQRMLARAGGDPPGGRRWMAPVATDEELKEEAPWTNGEQQTKP